MASRKENASRRSGKRQDKHIVAAGRRLDGVWTVTTYLRDGQGGKARRGLFWQINAAK